MAHENAEIVRQIYEEWAQGEFGNREPFHEDLDFEMAGWQVFQSDPVTAHGIDGMAQAWGDVLTDWDDFHTGPIEELIEVGNRILVFNRVGGRGRRAGIKVDSQRGAVFTFRGGKIVRLFLGGRDEALQAAGLSE